MRFLHFCVTLVLVLLSHQLFAQGKLMLVGGGAEDDGGWSDLPYTWMIDNAQNKKIAIISYSDADEWLPNYFLKLGAEQANNIKIDTRSLAQSQQIYDSLIQYDALFFKGGDQSRYYDYYKGTLVQNVIEQIYSQGGVIGGTSAGMAILSGVMFTAKEGSAYPIDALEDVNSSYITLTNDFLSFYPSYIFDTHFIERGRTPRLLGFLANWYIKKAELLNGIGVDDRTAFCINSLSVGTVYGSGAISVYSPLNITLDGNQSSFSKAVSLQLTHGHSYDLSNKTVADMNLSLVSVPSFSNTNYQVFGSGTTSLARNEDLLKEAIEKKKLEGGIIVIDQKSNTLSDNYKIFLESVQAEPVHIISTDETYNAADSSSVRNLIRSSSMVVVLADDGFIPFLAGGPTGDLLKAHFKRNQMTSVFLGDIVNQLGSVYCNNIYSDPLNAYKNNLSYETGLNLLPDIYFITNAYNIDDKDYYENISSSAVDAVLTNDLSVGVFLTDDANFSYFIDQNEYVNLHTSGSLSSLVLLNKGTRYEQTNEVTSSNRSRLQYAFDSLDFIITKDTDIQLQQVVAEDEEVYIYEEEPILGVSNSFDTEAIQLLRNPVEEEIIFDVKKPTQFFVTVFDLFGKVVVKEQISVSQPTVSVQELPQGMYHVLVTSEADSKNNLFKIIKSK